MPLMKSEQTKFFIPIQLASMVNLTVILQVAYKSFHTRHKGGGYPIPKSHLEYFSQSNQAKP